MTLSLFCVEIEWILACNAFVERLTLVEKTFVSTDPALLKCDTRVFLIQNSSPFGAYRGRETFFENNIYISFTNSCHWRALYFNRNLLEIMSVVLDVTAVYSSAMLRSMKLRKGRIYNFRFSAENKMTTKCSEFWVFSPNRLKQRVSGLIGTN